MTAEIMDYVNENVYGIWFLIGAARPGTSLLQFQASMRYTCAQ